MTIAGVLIVLGALLALAAVWPFGPYQLTLLIARRIRPFAPVPSAAEPTEGDAHTFAICLCVYNEKAVIRDKVEDLLRLRAAAGGGLDIAIYADAPSDGTSAILEEYRDQIRLVISPDRRGKTHGMNLLVAGTTASIVVFTDANVRIAPEAVAVLRRYFADESIGCVCSDLTYVNAGESPVAQVGSAFWSFNEWTKGLETDTGSVIGADGSLFAVRRSLHRVVPRGMFDDIYVSLSVLLAGKRVVRAPELRACETHSTHAAEEFRRKIRISCECMAVHFELWPELKQLGAWNVYKYLAHRFVRWIGGYLIAASLLCLLAAATIGFGLPPVVAAVAVAGALFALSVRLNLPFARLAWNVALAFAGNTVGVWKALRGHRAVTWEPPSSSRASGL